MHKRFQSIFSVLGMAFKSNKRGNPTHVKLGDRIQHKADHDRLLDCACQVYLLVMLEAWLSHKIAEREKSEGSGHFGFDWVLNGTLVAINLPPFLN